MRTSLILSVLVWYSLHLSQAAVEQNRDAGRKHIGEEYWSHGKPQDSICTRPMFQDILQCEKDILPFVANGFPWSLPSVSKIPNKLRNQQMKRGNFGDSLDPINHMCEVFDDFSRCLDQHAIPTECLLIRDGSGFEISVVFQFLCHIQPRSINLLHSLQCLKETRVVDLLVLHLADRTGTHLDDMAQGTVNAFFRFLQNPELWSKYITNPGVLFIATGRGLICLPESVLSHHAFFIIDRKCGSHAAYLVRDFYLYFRTRFNSVLGKMGFTTNICDKKTRRNPTIGSVSAVPDDTKRDGVLNRSIDQFLEENSPGTAMDTAWGRFIRVTIASMAEKEFCDPVLGTIKFQACLFVSYNPSGKARFNVLPYAHSVGPYNFAPFPDSSSLKLFRSCWNILQQMCGPNTTYYEYEYRISAGSREIQKMMDNVTCEWQDMLIRLYIEASEHGNLWPSTVNANQAPMFLSSGNYPYGSLTNSMSDLISVLSPGVKEISAKCSMASAERIKLFYQRLKYYLYIEIKLANLWRDSGLVGTLLGLWHEI